MKQWDDGKSLGNIREVNDGKPSEGMKKGTITLVSGEWIVRGDEQQSRYELESV